MRSRFKRSLDDPSVKNRARRFKKRRSRAPVNLTDKEVDLGDEIKKVFEESQHVAHEVGQKIVKSKGLRRLIKWSLVCLVSISFLVLGGLGIASYVFDKDEFKDFVISTLEEQTGGRVEVAASELSFFEGFWLKKLKIFPPQIGDDRGYRQGGAVEEKALIEIGEIRFSLAVVQILIGSINIKQAKLVSPKVFLKTNGPESNLSSILKYRSRRYPPEAESAKVEPKIDGKGDTDLGFTRSALFLPLRIEMQDIGFENLEVEIAEHSITWQPESTVFFTGLDAKIAISAFARKSKISLLLNGHENDQIVFSKENYDKSAITQLTAAFNTRLDLIDIRELNFGTSIKNARVFAAGRAFDHLNFGVDLKTEIAPSFDQIAINELKIKLLDAFAYQLTGNIDFSKLSQSLVRLKIAQSFDLDLQNLEPLLARVLPSATLGGALRMPRLSIEGELNTEKLSAEKLDLPHILGILSFDKLFATVPELGLEIEPIQGNLSIAAGPSMIGQGSQLDVVSDIRLGGIHFSDAGEGKLKLDIANLVTHLTSRVHYPIVEMPIMKFDVHAEKLVASGKEFAPIDVPFDFNLDADYRANFDLANLRARFGLANLAEGKVAIRCQDSCSTFENDINFDLASFEKVFNFARPILQRYVSLNDLPKKVGGVLDFRLHTKGTIPKPFENTPHHIIENGAIDFASQLVINDFLLDKDPVKIRGFNNRIGFEGNLVKQKISVRQTIESLVASMQNQKNSEKEKKLTVKNYKFETGLDTEFKGGLQLKSPLKNLVSSLDLEVNFGSFQIDKDLPYPLANIGIELKASQENLKYIKLPKLKLSVPDFGILMTLSGESKLDQNFKAESFASNLKLNIDQDEKSSLPTEIKTAGRVELEMKADSKNLNDISIEGQAAFEHFFVSVPAEAGIDEPLLVIEDMNGSFPVRQYLNLESIKKKIQKKMDPKMRAVAFVSADNGDALLQQEPNFQAVAKDYYERTNDQLSESTNLVALVDYGNVRPFFPGRYPISIKKIKVANLDLSRMEFDVEVKQNWFALNQYVIEILGGKVSGDLQLAFDPLPVVLKSSLHLTKLDTRKLLENFPELKGKAAGWSLVSDPYLDATVHLVYDMRNTNLDGAIEITKIGEEQLKMMLYYIDPKESDPTISQIRRALNFGEVKYVSVPLKNGLVGLDVGISILKAPIPMPKLRGFPIAQLIENVKSSQSAPAELDIDESESADGSAPGEPVPGGEKIEEVPIVH